MRAGEPSPVRPSHAPPSPFHQGSGWVVRLGLPVLVVAILAVVPTGATFGSPHVGMAPPIGAGTVAVTQPLAGPLLASGSAGSEIGSAPLAASSSHGNWSAVQVAFLVETTAYDGVYDSSAGDPGHDACAISGSLVCEESNGVPLIAARAGQIAQAITAAHPGSNLSFALADFFASTDAFDDGDGSAFHVDVQNFTHAGGFQAAVNSSLRTTVLSSSSVYGDSDLSDNILHSPSITALYGALGTAGFNWSSSTHHVVVLIGSTAPRAPGYAVNYSVSASDYQTFCGHSCLSPT